MNLDRMFKLGWKLYTTWEEARQSTPEQIELLKTWYAAFHGLSSLADVEDHMKQPRFCSLPDVMPLGATLCKWPSKTITWSVLQSLPNVPMVEAATEAMKRIAAVCGVTHVYQPNNPSAMIVLGTRRIDGTFGVLAESELPCGGVRQCRQWYDTGEQWAVFDGPGSGNRIDIVRVMTHELCHAHGMNHIGAGNLMAPTYSQSVIKPQDGDIQELQARYGPPVPQGPPPSTGEYHLHFVNGVLNIDGYRLTKLQGAA
jgi:hypothetical protein